MSRAAMLARLERLEAARSPVRVPAPLFPLTDDELARLLVIGADGPGPDDGELLADVTERLRSTGHRIASQMTGSQFAQIAARLYAVLDTE